jgi:hypothetical protein
MDSLPLEDARPGVIEALVYTGGRGPTKEWAPQLPTSLWNGGLPVYAFTPGPPPRYAGLTARGRPILGKDAPWEPLCWWALVCGLLVVTGPLALVFCFWGTRRTVTRLRRGYGAALVGGVLGVVSTFVLLLVVVVALVTR